MTLQNGRRFSKLGYSTERTEGAAAFRNEGNAAACFYARARIWKFAAGAAWDRLAGKNMKISSVHRR